MVRPKKDTTLHDRFQANVKADLVTGCLLWTGAVDGNGYGQIKSGRVGLRAHRVAWEFFRGPIPEGMFICHRCDVPRCCNPEHLFVGTARDNVIDKIKKGRGRPVLRPKRVPKDSDFNAGEKNGNSKLTRRRVDLIRRLAASGMTYRAISARLKVPHTTVGAVVRRETWR